MEHDCNTSDWIIRSATPEDAQQVWDIYQYYVKNTAISFEITMPSVDEISKRITRTTSAFPYFVAATESGRILGYAYAGPFIPREAYSHCCEVSIYVSNENKRRGLGKALYKELFTQLQAMNITNIYACIGVPEQDDEYLNHNSAQFHAHMGFQEVGRFRNSGYKFGRYYHMIWMEKIFT